MAGPSSAVPNGLGQLDQRSISQATGCPQAVKDLPIERAADPSRTSLYRINAAGSEVRAQLSNMGSFYCFCAFFSESCSSLKRDVKTRIVLAYCFDIDSCRVSSSQPFMHLV
jgi:hypothetical protein